MCTMDFEQEIVSIYVGERHKCYYMHKSLLRQHSAYFSHLFGPNFKEGEEGITTLNQVSEATFNIFQKWLMLQWTRQLFSKTTAMEQRLFKDTSAVANKEPGDATSVSGEDDGSGDDNEDNIVPGAASSSDDYLSSDSSSSSEESQSRIDPATRLFHPHPPTAEDAIQEKLYDDMVVHLLDLYIFADAYETPTLRNDIMSIFCLFEKLRNLWPGIACVPHAFDHLPASSTMCQYLIKATATFWNGSVNENDVNAEALLPAEFFIPVMRINARHHGIGNEELLAELEDWCNFHEHEGGFEGEERKNCKAMRKADMTFIKGLISICVAAVDASKVTANPVAEPLT